MDTIFISLIIGIGIVIATMVAGFFSVHLTSKVLSPKTASLAKAFAFTVIAFGLSWVVHSFLQQIIGVVPMDYSPGNATRFIIRIIATVVAWLISMLSIWMLARRMFGTPPGTTVKITVGILGILSVSTMTSLWRLIDWWMHSMKVH